MDRPPSDPLKLCNRLNVPRVFNSYNAPKLSKPQSVTLPYILPFESRAVLPKLVMHHTSIMGSNRYTHDRVLSVIASPSIVLGALRRGKIVAAEWSTKRSTINAE